MPELPDVATFRGYLDATALHRTIVGAVIRDRRIVSGISSRNLRSRLTGNEIAATRRHGKVLFALLGNGESLALHFGMTGSLSYFKNSSEESPYARLILEFQNGYHLAYESRRRLGRIHLVKDAQRFISEKKLGPDALECDSREFEKAIFGGSGKGIKAALMDQHLIAGIGNVYSDEILFQAGVSPKRKSSGLNDKTKRKLFHTMKRVLETTIRNQADPARFPRTYLTRHRRKGEECPKCGSRLRTIRQGGRTAFYCPKDQT